MSAREGRSSVRRAALEVLIPSEDRFVDELLAERGDEHSGRDRRLLQEIVYGPVRHQLTLDRLVDFYLKLPLSRQKAPLRWALRLAAYQLVYLRRVPSHAALDQTLEALKGIEGVSRREVGFANAVLRRLGADILRKSDEPPVDPHDPAVLPIREGWCHFRRPFLPLHSIEPIAHHSLKRSHPQWLVERWLARFGEEELVQLLDAGNRTPEISARVTPLAPSREELLAVLGSEGIEAEADAADGVVVIHGGSLAKSSALARGWMQVQDRTAIAIGAVLSPPANSRVLDLCAAPGGKALQLLERIGDGGRLVACDRSDAKLALLRENLERGGAPFTLVRVGDDPGEISLGESFTHVLVDAPCSNTGVLARRPEARWRLRPSDVRRLCELQSKLLEAAWRHLLPGGRLLYATCSIEPEENEERVAAIVQSHPELVELETRQFLPHRTRGDGGFYSLLLRPRPAD